MKIWSNTCDIQIEYPTAVVIGKFDGEHRGHKKLIKSLREIACKKNLKTVVFTFFTPPGETLHENDRRLITTNSERRDNLSREGIDYLIEYPFNENTSKLDGETFLNDVLIKRLNMKAIVAGPDCAFGYNRSGNADMLKKLGPLLGFETVIIEKEKEGQRDISSSYIRQVLGEGNVKKAGELMGEPYIIEGEVIAGNHIGKSRLGFPTVNILTPQEKILPKFGVYRTKVITKYGEFNGLTNVGDNPSVSCDSLKHVARVETYLLGFNGDLYGTNIQVKFCNFIRPQKHFKDLNQLKDQINMDLKNVQAQI